MIDRMKYEELKELMTVPETPSVEFKPALLSRKELAEYAVGIGNAGGGHIIMGVSDKRPRRILPIERVSDAEIHRIRESVADAAQIHIGLDHLETPDGMVLVATIPPRPRGMPFHTRDGKYLVRLGEELRGMTVPELDGIRQEAGVEFTAQVVEGPVAQLVSAVAMEDLRRLMLEAGASSDFTALSDSDLLRSLGVINREGRLTTAGLLLAGSGEALRRHAPSARWQFFRMLSDTDYDLQDGGADSIATTMRRVRELITANNPIVTIPGWLVHPEFPRYPALALRELLVNALAHRDYLSPGSVTVKLYPDRMEISNAGGFPADITPDNILHHASSPRNPALFEALARMRLANAANLGVPRVFRELLSEGKEPPYYATTGKTVIVAIKGQETRKEFLELVKNHPGIDVDELLVIHFLTRHREVSARQAAEMSQRPLESARELLSRLAAGRGLLESGGGSGRGKYYRLSRSGYEQLLRTLDYYVDKRLGTHNAKARVLSALAERDLSNAEVREITQMDRFQVIRLMDALREEGLVALTGQKKGARWHLSGDQKK